jgi:hypothetical protein
MKIPRNPTLTHFRAVEYHGARSGRSEPAGPRIHPCPIVPIGPTTRARIDRVELAHTEPAFRPRYERRLIVTDRAHPKPRRCYVWRPKFAGASAVR